MKKLFIIAGIVLLVAAAGCFIVSRHYDRLGGLVMDAEGDFYARVHRKYLLFQKCGIGTALSSVLLLAFGILKR